MGLLANLIVKAIPQLGASVFRLWRGPPAIAQLAIAQQALSFKPCEILRTQSEIDRSSRFLRDQGLLLNECDAKNWDLAHILPRLGHGNMLDMGCQGSIVLDNAKRLGLAGEKIGIDLVELPPRAGIRLIKGDLTDTGLPAAHFDY